MTIKPHPAAAELSEKFPLFAHLIGAWGDRFGETITDPVPGVHALVEELDARFLAREIPDLVPGLMP